MKLNIVVDIKLFKYSFWLGPQEQINLEILKIGTKITMMFKILLICNANIMIIRTQFRNITTDTFLHLPQDFLQILAESLGLQNVFPYRLM